MAEFRDFAETLGFQSQVADPDVGALRRQCHRQKPERCPGTTGRRCSRISKRSMSKPALAEKPFRMPVQWVNRPNLDFRGFSGTIVGGRVKPGDDDRGGQIGPHRARSRASSRWMAISTKRSRAQAVTLALADEVDISRGDVLARPMRGPKSPTSSRPIFSGWRKRNCCRAANICSRSAPQPCPATITALKHKVDVNTLDHLAAQDAAAERGRLLPISRRRSRSRSILYATTATPAASS